jgi:hypothetical protein
MRPISAVNAECLRTKRNEFSRRATDYVAVHNAHCGDGDFFACNQMLGGVMFGAHVARARFLPPTGIFAFGRRNRFARFASVPSTWRSMP